MGTAVSLCVLYLGLGSPDWAEREAAQTRLEGLQLSIPRWHALRDLRSTNPEIEARWHRAMSVQADRLVDTLLPPTAVWWPDIEQVTGVPYEFGKTDPEGNAIPETGDLFRGLVTPEYENEACRQWSNDCSYLDSSPSFFPSYRSYTRAVFVRGLWRMKEPERAVEFARLLPPPVAFDRPPTPIETLWCLCHADRLLVRPLHSSVLLQLPPVRALEQVAGACRYAVAPHGPHP